MDSPLLNVIGAIGIGLLIGVSGGLALKGQRASAVWLAPVLALCGSLAATLLARLFGNDPLYGWREVILQLVLATAGVWAAYFLGTGTGTGTTRRLPPA